MVAYNFSVSDTLNITDIVAPKYIPYPFADALLISFWFLVSFSLFTNCLYDILKIKLIYKQPVSKEFKKLFLVIIIIFILSIIVGYFRFGSSLLENKMK
jgi:hypothetical protein